MGDSAIFMVLPMEVIITYSRISRTTLLFILLPIEVGYSRPEHGFDADSSAVLTSIEEQSPDIVLGISSEG